MDRPHFCYHCDKEYSKEDYARHVRTVVTRLAGEVNEETGEEEVPEFLEEWIAEQTGAKPEPDAATTEEPSN
jgi:hypothetical protein